MNLVIGLVILAAVLLAGGVYYFFFYDKGGENQSTPVPGPTGGVICPPISDQNLAGGYSDASLDVGTKAADFAVTQIMGSLVGYELLCVQTQVVAGTNYRMGIKIGTDIYAATVYEDLQGNMSLSNSSKQ